MDKIINLLKCSPSGSSDNSLLYGYMTTKTYFKVPRWVWSLLLLCFITVNALFIALCLSVDTSSILHYKSYDCKYIDDAAPSIIEYKSTTTADKYYYYILNVTMYHDDAGTGGQDLTVLSSVIWDDFCKTSSSSESKECLEDYIGSEHDDSFTCYAIQTSVERFTTKKVSSVGGKSINISLRKDLTSNYMGELYWTIPLALVIVLIIAIGYIMFGFFYFDGRSKFSLDRFIRQVIKDPFMLSGDSTTYRLEESSSMNVILQDPTERQKEVLLRLDKRALLLSENTQDEEPTSQLQEMALASLDTDDDGNKVHPVYLLMRNTATEEHETILYYERPSTDNMKRCRKSTLKLLLAFWILIIPTFFIMFILAILSLVLLESIIISLCLWELSIIIVFFITHTSLVKLIPVYQGIHYMITSSRVVIIESLPLKLGYTLHCITHDKIGQVWHGSLNENHPTTHVTLEDRKEGQLMAEIKTNKDEATTGILFEYCTDVRSSIDLIEQRQGNSSNFSIE